MKNTFYKLKSYLLVLSLFFTSPFLLSAEVGTEDPPNRLPSPFKAGDITIFDFITFVLNNIVLPIGTVVAVFFFIYSGFMFVTARGSEDKLTTAKKAFLGAVIGTAILLGAVAISLAIQGTICQIANIPGVCR